MRSVEFSGEAVARGGFLARMRDRLCEFRNRLVQDPRVQKFAVANPLTRRIARAKARQLFDLLAGFVYSQILFSCVSLGLFERLEAGARTVDQLANEAGLPESGMRRLVDAAVALDLLEWRSGGLVGLGELGAALNANPGVKAMVRHHADLYRDLADPVTLLKGEAAERRLNSYWAYATAADPASLRADQVSDYSDLMAQSQQFIAQEVLASYDISRHRRLLDIGGGDGTFAEAAVRSSPELSATVFDLPAVAERASARVRMLGLGDRIMPAGGDFARDALPAGADLVTLVRVLYDHPDEKALTVLKAARRAIMPGGRVLIAEPMADALGAGRVGDAYFGFYLMAMGDGRARRPRELMSLLVEAGFNAPRIVATRMPLQTGIVIADA